MLNSIASCGFFLEAVYLCSLALSWDHETCLKHIKSLVVAVFFHQVINEIFTSFTISTSTYERLFSKYLICLRTSVYWQEQPNSLYWDHARQRKVVL